MSQETDQRLIPELPLAQNAAVKVQEEDGSVFDSLSYLESCDQSPFLDNANDIPPRYSEKPEPDATHYVLEQQKRQSDDAKCNGIISFALMALILTMTCWLIHGILAARIAAGTISVEELFWWIITTMRVAILSLVVVLVAAVVDWTLGLECMEPLT